LDVRDIVRRALAEDGAARDLTGPLLDGRRARGRLLAKQDLVLAGLEGAAEAFRQMGARFTPKARDGAAIRKGRVVGVV
jgi:nicotinate-nucleotide pyrophosphorylase